MLTFKVLYVLCHKRQTLGWAAGNRWWLTRSFLNPFRLLFPNYKVQIFVIHDLHPFASASAGLETVLYGSKKRKQLCVLLCVQKSEKSAQWTHRLAPYIKGSLQECQNIVCVCVRVCLFSIWPRDSSAALPFSSAWGSCLVSGTTMHSPQPVLFASCIWADSGALMD